MTTPVKIGVQIPNQRTSFQDYKDAWLHADAIRVDSIWNWDHFFPLSRLLSDSTYVDEPGGEHLEAWTLLATIGPLIKHARFGCLCNSMSYRNPALLSAMATTLDHATGGRFILGLGAGWYERDYQEYGYHFGTPAERLMNLERGLEIVTERWTRDHPQPLRGRVPILIAGSGAKVTLRIAATYADIWNGVAPLANWITANTVLDEWCVKLDRDPSTIERTVLISAERDLDDIDGYVSAGCSHIIFRPGMRAPIDFSRVDELLSWRDRRRERTRGLHGVDQEDTVDRGTGHDSGGVGTDSALPAGETINGVP